MHFANQDAIVIYQNCTHFYCTDCKHTFCLTETEIPNIEVPQNFKLEGANLVLKGNATNVTNRLSTLQFDCTKYFYICSLMKIFVILFSIYFLALSVMPCTDACDINISNSSKSEFTKISNDQTNCKDVCSPFCSCACCHTVVNFTFQTFKISEQSRVSANSKNSHFGISISFPITTETFGNRQRLMLNIF
jgi:hypothetical protein